MFTGIIEHTGRIVDSTPTEAGRRLVVDPGGWDHRPEAGDSIAINGCCLTIIETPAPGTPFRFDVITQTLEVTTLGTLRSGDRVNMESALRMGDPLGGHLVQGHVDGQGTVAAIIDGDAAYHVRVRASSDLCDMIVERGSIAVDGVSLTVAALHPDGFEIALIPTTLELTTMGERSVGDHVNLEVDMIARTVVHWLTRQGTPSAG